MRWFTEKRNLIESVFAIFLIVVLGVLWYWLPAPTGQVYDCRLAEISPDFPPQVREECRKLRTISL